MTTSFAYTKIKTHKARPIEKPCKTKPKNPHNFHVSTSYV